MEKQPKHVYKQGEGSNLDYATIYYYDGSRKSLEY
jgi:hypothetical protein